MDWPKAKTILILGFLLLDLYLAYLLFLAPGTQALPTTLDMTGLNKLRELTDHYNYSLQTTPSPMETGKLPVMQASVKLFSQQELDEVVLAWLGKQVPGEGLANGRIAYSTGARFLYLGQDGALRFEDRSPVQDSASIGRQEAVDQLISFLEQRVDQETLKEYQPSLEVQLKDESWLVELNRHIRGAPLFADKIRAVIVSNQVRTVETRVGLTTKLSWLSPRSAVVTADRAILRFLAQQAKPREESVEIIDVRLGYDFTNADRQELMPVWRVMTEQVDEEYIVPAGVRFWRSGGP